MKAEAEKSTNIAQPPAEAAERDGTIDVQGDGAVDSTPLATAQVEATPAPPDQGDAVTGPAIAARTTVVAPSPGPITPARQPRLRRLLVRANLALGGLGLDDRLGRILLSIVLAVILWFYVTGLENPSQTTSFRSLPLQVRGIETNLKLVSTTSLPTVDVSLQAPQNVLSTLQAGDIHPFINLSGLGPGVHRVSVQVESDGGIGKSLSNLSVSPSDVQIQLEVQATRTFPVEVEVIGSPALGYLPELPQVEPSQVSITGSESAISRIASVVVTVDVDEKASTQRGFRTPVALDSAGQEIPGLTFTPSSVQVTVPIKGSLSNKLVPVRVPIVGNPAPGYSVDDIKIEPTNVTLCCTPGNILDEIESVTTAPVSISGTTSTVITTTQLILPAGVQLSPGQSSTITVTVSVSTFDTTWQLSAAPVVEGLPPGYAAVLSPTSIDLTLSGTFAQFQALTPTDVRATINVSSLGAGTYELAPQVTIPNDIRLVSVNPPAVTVSIIPPTPVPPTPTATPIPQPTATATPITEAPATAVPTATNTPTPIRPVPTNTLAPPAPTSTATASPTATLPPPTATHTPAPTTPLPATPTPTPTNETP
jgi:YbbR domain-containing protein